MSQAASIEEVAGRSPGRIAPASGATEAGLRGRLAGFRRYALVLAVYLGATYATAAHFMGDTSMYARVILGGQSGDHGFGEFGHLLWYPVGWALSHLSMPAVRLMVRADAYTSALITLMAINWLAGLLSVFMLHAVVRKVAQREWIANVAAVGLIFSQGFLNYAHTGTAYVPGLALLLLGLYLFVTGAEAPAQSARGWGAGAALAGAVGLWFNYILAIPAALAFPFLAGGPNRGRWRVVRQGAVAFAAATALLYGSAAVLQGIHTVAGLREWVVSSQHGITRIAGVPRMLFGFPRSFINMGDDGVVFKRFVVHDPLTPVSLADLFRLSLWKVGLFYLLLASMAAMLLRSERGRRILGLLALSGAPVLAFAVSWQGGDMERYLPLYPMFFVSFAYGLWSGRSSPVFNIVVAVFTATAIVSSVGAMATPVLAHRQDQVVKRIRDVLPLLKPRSMVTTVTLQDGVYAFAYDFPLHPINRAGVLSVYWVVLPGTNQVLQWRRAFASQTFSVWSAGGDMWVSNRVLSSRPRSEWNWVEGDDRRVSWREIYGFFSRLEMGKSVGGDDGFVLLVSSPRNRDSLKGWLGPGSG
jgi:hypothetical protein